MLKCLLFKYNRIWYYMFEDLNAKTMSYDIVVVLGFFVKNINFMGEMEKKGNYREMFGNSKDKVTPIHNSLQIWYEGKNSNVKLQLDINVWRLKSTWARNIYLDFGLRVSDPNSVEKVYIYFPFNIEKSNIVDLGKELVNASLLNGIFNENYVISTNTKNIFVREENSNKTIFSIYQLDVNKDIEVKENYSGTVLAFAVKNSNHPKYYRFRIKNLNYGSLFEKYKPQNSFFESAFIETEIIDFRINEKRNQDNGLMEEIEENNRFDIEIINFFVMSPIQDEIDSDGINLVYKRQLEMGNFWGAYLGKKYKKMSVYKCKTIKGISNNEDFNCFCKIKYRKSNVLTILIYLVVLCGLTVVFNLISDFVGLFLKLKM